MSLHPREFALLTPEAMGGRAAYRKACRIAGVEPTPTGYGLLFCEDDDGRRVTVLTEDVAYVSMLAQAAPGVLAALSMPIEEFPRRRDGWPDEWLAAPSPSRRP